MKNIGFFLSLGAALFVFNLDAGSAPNGNLEAQNKYEQGKALYLKDHKNIESARKLLEQADALDPDLVEAQIFLGIIAVNQQEFEKALQWLDKSQATDIRIGRQHSRVFFIKARCFQQLGRYDEAFAAMRIAWPFYQKSEVDKREWQSAHDEILMKWRMYYGANAHLLIHCQDKVDLSKFFFIVINADNQEMLSKDSDLGPPTQEFLSQKASLAVLIVPENAKQTSRYLVLFRDGKIIGSAAYVQRFEEGKTLAVKPEEITKAYRPRELKAADCCSKLGWTPVNLKSDAGGDIPALILNSVE